jgi:hypothetical protein
MERSEWRLGRAIPTERRLTVTFSQSSPPA